MTNEVRSLFQDIRPKAEAVLGRLDVNDYESVTAKNLDLMFAEWARPVIALHDALEDAEDERDRYRNALERVYQVGRGPHVGIAREALDAT